MAGRLAAPTGFVPFEWRGLGTRAAREYLVASLALQDNPDRFRAQLLWAKILAARSAKTEIGG